jgi:hypothetical protein
MYNRSSRPARNRDRSRLLGEAFPDGRRMAEDEETEFPAQLIAPIISNAELDRLIVDLGTNPLAKGELRQVRQGVYLSLSQSQPQNLVALLNTFSRLCQPIADQIFCGDGGVPARF